MIIHGLQDEVIPNYHGKDLRCKVFEAHQERWIKSWKQNFPTDMKMSIPVMGIWVPNAMHNDVEVWMHEDFYVSFQEFSKLMDWWGQTVKLLANPRGRSSSSSNDNNNNDTNEPPVPSPGGRKNKVVIPPPPPECIRRSSEAMTVDLDDVETGGGFSSSLCSS